MPDDFGAVYINKYNVMMGKEDWMVLEPFTKLGGPRAQWKGGEWENPTDEMLFGNQDAQWIAKEMEMDPDELAAIEKEAREEYEREKAEQ